MKQQYILALLPLSLWLLWGCSSPRESSEGSPQVEDSQPEREPDLSQLLLDALNREEYRLPEREAPLPVSIGDIGLGPEAIPTPFAERLTQELSFAIDRCTFLQKRTDLSEVEDELARALYPEIYDTRPETKAPELGQLSLANGILKANYWLEGGRIIVLCELIEVQSALVLFTTRVEVDGNHGMQNDVRPEQIQSIETALENLEPKKEADFKTRIWTGESLLHEGDPLKIYFRSAEACFVKIYHVNATGDVQLVYPCLEEEARLIEAGELLSLPEGNATYTAREPFGTDILFATASSERFETYEQCEQILGLRGQVRQIRTRGLGVRVSGTESVRRGHTRCTFTTVP